MFPGICGLSLHFAFVLLELTDGDSLSQWGSVGGGFGATRANTAPPERSSAGLRKRLGRRFAGAEGAVREVWTSGGLGARVAALYGVAQ